MKKTLINGNIPSSFRDPSGFLFFRDGVVYRQVNTIYKENYEHLIKSRLYETLVGAALLIPHEEVNLNSVKLGGTYKTIKPELIKFISYPYEWAFSQLKSAALTILKIQRMSLDFGMSLKDCSAYNIQFRNCKAILIDTLSFEKYREGQPWVAYRQFCKHFLAPLALISHADVRHSQLLRIYIDGVPLDLASSLLPFRTYLSFSLLSHIHLHAKSQKYFAHKTVSVNNHKMSRFGFLALLDSLESAINNLKWAPHGTEWADYYKDTNYSLDAFSAKKCLVSQFLDKINPETVWDLGANMGEFSRIGCKEGRQIIAFDNDPASVEKNYLRCIEEGETNILPLLLDLTNPSSSIGWANKERMSLLERGPADVALVLALVHHLAISNNLPFNNIADFFSKLCNWLVIEFVPKNDSQVQRLLSTREDIFTDYTRHAFEREFEKFFEIRESENIKTSQRTLYLMENKKQ